MTKRIGIIGAGPAGLTAAYVLTRACGKLAAVDLYESGRAVGGMARSMKLWGQTVDIGPHRFFSRDRRVNQLWLDVVGRDYRMVKRLTRVLYKGRFFDYPINPWNALANLGPDEAVRCALSYVTEKLLRCWGRPSSSIDESFESWVRGRFGKRLYEIFFKSYSEKLWGISCCDLDADFAAQRIKSFSLGAAITSALCGPKIGKHRTLVDEFAYPIHGTGMVYERMAKTIQNQGGNVFTGTSVHSVVTHEGCVKGVQLADRSFREYDAVISSMPLTMLAARLDEAPDSVREQVKRLTFRNTILVYLEAASDSVCQDNWIYVQDPDLLTGRITNFRNWVRELHGDSRHSILAMEYWCGDNDPLWQQRDDELTGLAQRELIATGLVASPSLLKRRMVCRISSSYPVYRRGYRAILRPVQDYLSTVEGLQVIGRYGAFKYNNQDHSILMGLLAAENVLGAQHDLWDVNCDYDRYQEDCCITDTGLASEHDCTSAIASDELVPVPARCPEEIPDEATEMLCSSN